MPQGLQVFNPDGSVLFDTSTWVSQILGNVSLAANHTAGSVSNAGLTRGRPFFFVLPAEGNEGSTAEGNPVNKIVTVSGTTLSWNAGKFPAQIVYGIF